MRGSPAARGNSPTLERYCLSFVLVAMLEPRHEPDLDLGRKLALVFGLANDELPQPFLDLLDRLARTSARLRPAPGTLSDEEFRRGIEATLPELRAFARNLTRDHEAADDLVQDTMMKAWAARDRFEAGTSLRAWTYVIARNLFLTARRRDKFHGEWNEESASRRLAAPASQEQPLHLADVAKALDKISPSQREALLLVGASGMSYEEAAQAMGSMVGTVKSRVSRGRQMLERLMTGDSTQP